jgi:hypothetical protein
MEIGTTVSARSVAIPGHVPKNSLVARHGNRTVIANGLPWHSSGLAFSGSFVSPGLS